MEPAYKKRLMKELKDIDKDPPSNCSARLLGTDILHWKGYIYGPEGSPFAGGIYELDIKFSDEYPFSPPHIEFITPVFHPNINSDGEICVNLLKEQWSPALTISQVLVAICSLLTDPNPDDPLVPHIAKLYRTDKDAYNEQVKNHVREYATKKPT